MLVVGSPLTLAQHTNIYLYQISLVEVSKYTVWALYRLKQNSLGGQPKSSEYLGEEEGAERRAQEKGILGKFGCRPALPGENSIERMYKVYVSIYVSVLLKESR